jgi:hypothetical protein
LIYQLQLNQYIALENISRSETNHKNYSSYIEKINSVEYGKFKNPINKYKESDLLKIERILCNQMILAAPRDFSITVYLFRTDLYGNNTFERKSSKFYADDIKRIIKRLNDKSGYHYNDRGIWDALCRVERAKVSNKMRFAIYERDGYRCKHCGIIDDGSNLEIDHIKPISRGGKSTLDNLQTLCHDCNQRKGSDYY